MDEPGKTLQEKLRAKREALNSTLPTKREETQNVTTVDSDDDEDDQIPMLQDHLEEVNETEEAAANRLKETLNSRHDATRRRLQRSEILSPQPQALSPTTEPVKSPLQSQELASPRSDGESIHGSSLGRSTGAHSLRSRLLEKIRANTQQRSQSPEVQRGMRLRDKTSKVTRFDERELQEKVAAKLLMMRAIRKERVESGLPTEVDCYDFFTKQYDDRPPQPANEPEESVPLDETAGPSSQGQSASQDVTQEAQEQPLQEEPQEETENERKKLITEIIPPELDFKLFSMMSAQYPGYRVYVEEEQKVSFVPSVADAPPESKNLDDTTPVYLEEEGFYVGMMPEVQIRNRNILENRLLSQEAVNHKSWFGPDGRVKILPDPVRMNPLKPWVSSSDHPIDRSIETVYVKAYESTVEEKYLEGTDEHELQIDIGMIAFHHHPLMSREHVLASKMSESYEAYIKHRQKNYAIFYQEKLRTLRLALKTMKRYSSMSPERHEEDNKSYGNQALRIQDYLIEIRRTCNQRDKAELYERDLIRKIISEWNEIRKLREIQAFNNTSVKLTVRKQEVDQGSDRTEWMSEIDQQLQECQEEYEYTILRPHKKQTNQYQRDMQEWKKKRNKLRQQRKRAAAISENADALSQDEDDEIITGANPKPLKPVAPDSFDENQVREKLINQALGHRRNPGESKLSLEVTNIGNVTPTTQVPEGEASRRRALQSCSIIAQIKINGKDVCTSEPKLITSDFQVHFGQIFKIFISQWPDTIKVQIKEVGRLSNTLLSEIFLAIPDASVNSANAQSFPTEFTNSRIIAHNNHEGVGSSTPFNLYSDANAAPVSLKTRGCLYLSIAWGLTDGGRVLAPKILTQHGLDLGEGGNLRQRNLLSGESEMDALWSQEGKLDPNDPGNAGLITFGNAQEGFIPAMDFFRLDQLQEQFDFVSEEEIAKARRLRVLEYRSKGVTEFRNLSMVPANEHEILDSVFTMYERRKREKDALGDAAEQKVSAGIISAHRLEVLRFRQRVRDSVLRRFYSAKHYYTLEDMVIEEQVPDIGTLGLNILKVVEPRRPLKPARTERKKAASQNLTEGSVTILVSVVRATNLPIRDRHQTPPNQNELSAIMGITNQSAQLPPSDHFDLSPFVSVSFQSNVKATGIADGPNPSWNEEIVMPFSAPNNDYSPDNMQTVDDVLFIHVFDRVVTDAGGDNRDRNDVGETSGAATGVVSHRIQNHWLGSLKLPFSTIYQRGKIEGTFKLNIPAMMLGYSTVYSNKHLQPQEGSSLTVYVTLEPELSKLEPVPQKFETQEEQKLIDESIRFMQECRKKFPKRKIKTTVINIRGESVFITRYVKPIAPPPSLLEGSSQDSLITAERLARYVSLIPFVSDNVIYAGTCDLWSTCDEFMSMLCGDEEEHAVLLLNFFLHIGIQAYLVLGHAIPEGDTAYVLTVSESQGHLLWNASTGQHYKATDSLCPLQSVYGLVNQDNIWFNMQIHDMPSQMKFIVHPPGWKALFKSPSATQGLASIQPDTLVFPDTDIIYTRRLEEKIERILKDSFMNSRRHVTSWNRYCSSALKQTLEGMELERYGGPATGIRNRRVTRDDHIDRLKQLIGDARFIGFPMDLAFTDVDAVVKAVMSTEVHKIQDDNVQFALAVHVHPYPASVLCVWVYLAAIHNKRPY